MYKPRAHIAIPCAEEACTRVCLLHACTENLIQRPCMSINAPKCACRQVMSVHHPCMCHDAHRGDGCVQSRMHVHLRTMLVPEQACTCTHLELTGPSPWYTRHVLCMWPACIHDMRRTSGRHMQHAWSRQDTCMYIPRKDVCTWET